MKKIARLPILAAALATLATGPLAANPPVQGECPEGWTGPNCDYQATCYQGLCGSHGTCVDEWWNNPNFSCSCYGGWSGTYCEVPPPATHHGMTWTLISQYSTTVSHVGADSGTNAYYGDTAATTSLPILCLYVDNSAPPSGLTPNFFNGWGKGQVALSASVTGSSLTSLAVADGICSSTFGTGWRMAEHHDGWYGAGLAYQGGWSFLAYGTISPSTRFWVYINDQPANPWN